MVYSQQSRKVNKKYFNLNFRSQFFSYFSLGLIVALLGVLSAINIRYYFTRPKILGVTTNAESLAESSFSEELLYWQNVVTQNPQYLDGWLELSRLASQHRDWGKALDALTNAKKINPNSKEISTLEATLAH